MARAWRSWWTIWPLLPCLLPGLAGAGQIHRYTVRVAADLSGLQVRACFGEPRPARLQIQDAAARQRLLWLRAGDDPAASDLAPGGDQVVLPHTGCVRYAVRLAAAGDDWHGVRRDAGTLLVSPHEWLWHPEPPAEVELAFELPDDVGVSAPWDRQAEGPAGPVYRLGPRPYAWDSLIGIGRFRPASIHVPGGRLEIALLGREDALDRAAMLRWIEASARSLADLYGRFPVPRLQVLVVPAGPADEPVPWGEVMRGGGDAVHLYVDPGRPLKEFLDDWTVAHELSHLLHPLLGPGAEWISEGLASYYQNVLRARAGLLEPRQAWQKLHEGFGRGMRGTPQDLTLEQATRRMREGRLFMRVYWSGAALALMADVELRRRSAGRQSLASALAALQACCLPATERWSGRALLERLDALTGTRVFGELYERHAGSREFPALGALYGELGLAEGPDGVLTYRDDAPLAELRRAIMAPPAEDRR